MARIIRPEESKIRSQRVRSGLDNLVVESRTLGTQMPYRLQTENISKTGLLLGVGNYKKVPFQVNTLLEIKLEDRSLTLERPIHCVGKVVRTEQDHSNRPRFGIHIVQIDNKDYASWENFVGSMLEETPALPEAS